MKIIYESDDSLFEQLTQLSVSVYQLTSKSLNIKRARPVLAFSPVSTYYCLACKFISNFVGNWHKLTGNIYEPYLFTNNWLSDNNVITNSAFISGCGYMHSLSFRVSSHWKLESIKCGHLQQLFLSWVFTFFSHSFVIFLSPSHSHSHQQL